MTDYPYLNEPPRSPEKIANEADKWKDWLEDTADKPGPTVKGEDVAEWAKRQASGENDDQRSG